MIMNGISFTLVLGFNTSVFFGIERGVTFSVQAGFLSGKPPQGGSLNLNLVLGTASKPLTFLSFCTPNYPLPSRCKRCFHKSSSSTTCN